MPTAVEPIESGTMRRAGTAATVLCWALALATAAWALARLFGLERGFPFVEAVAFTPYVALAAPIALLVALARRRWWAAGVAALSVLTLAACVLPRQFGHARPGPGPALLVMSANLRIGGADPDAVVALVRDRHVDLLALQEYTPDADRALIAAGLADVLPYRVAYPDEAASGSALYSRFPLRDEGRRVNPYRFLQARATLTVPGAQPVHVESVHPCAPVDPDSADAWFRALAGEPPATPRGDVRLLLGDFNATQDHGVLRRLIATGYRDAAASVGRGLTPTWPYDGRPLPRVQLDHVLADRRIAVSSFGTAPLPRSDHRAILVQLHLPPG